MVARSCIPVNLSGTFAPKLAWAVIEGQPPLLQNPDPIKRSCTDSLENYPTKKI